MTRSRLKSLIKDWLPPVFLRLYRKWDKGGIRYVGDYASWQEAVDHSTGYDSDLILDKVSTALLKVKSGEAVYERDSVLFDRIEYPFPVLAGLLHMAAANDGKLTVLDFGGSLGSTYFQCRDFLSVLPELKWCIVEQPIFVQRGRELFESDQLRFFFSMQECIEKEMPNVVLFSGVLQYIQNPFELLKTAMDTEAQYIIIDRTPFSDEDQDRLCVQHVPPKIYDAKLPCWIFSLGQFTETLSSKFDLIADFASDPIRGVGFQFMGSIWRRRTLPN